MVPRSIFGGEKQKAANLVGFAAAVLLRLFERLLDAHLCARRDPPAERKAQQQRKDQEQRERE
jgi:hypothetical protein